MAAPRPPLTPRMRDCLHAIWQGSSNAGIADALGIGEGAARNLVCATLRRLGARTREEAAAWYERSGGAAVLDDDEATAYELLDRSLAIVEAKLCEVEATLGALRRALDYPRRYTERRREGGPDAA